jgi:hypothetical protein
VSANILHLKCRPIFLVNVPIGLVLFVLVRVSVPRRDSDPARSFHPIGVVSLVATVACLVIPLVFGPDLGWPAWSIALLVLVVPFAVLCAWHERRISGRDPILSGEVVAARGFVSVLAFMVLMQSSYAGSLLVQALHFESGLGVSALRTGLLFISGGAGFALCSLTWRKFPAWSHSYFMIGGMLNGAAGYVIMAWSLRTAAEPGTLYLTVNFVLSAGFGYGFGPVLSRVGPVARAAEVRGQCQRHPGVHPSDRTVARYRCLRVDLLRHGAQRIGQGIGWSLRAHAVLGSPRLRGRCPRQPGLHPHDQGEGGCPAVTKSRAHRAVLQARPDLPPPGVPGPAGSRPWPVALQTAVRRLVKRGAGR